MTSTTLYQAQKEHMKASGSIQQVVVTPQYLIEKFGLGKSEPNIRSAKMIKMTK
jgi:hypothetical protein